MTAKKKTSPAVMKLVNRRDKNTRALAKVVSAIEWLKDQYAESAQASAAVRILEQAKFSIIQERRNLNVALWKEVDQQKQESPSHGKN
jgi:hypothetical protein